MMVDKNDNKSYELCSAAKSGDISLVKKLLSEGVSPNSEDEDGIAAILCSVYNRNHEIAMLLIEWKANVNARNLSCGETALDIVATYGEGTYDEIRLAKMLLDNGADINERIIYNNQTMLFETYNQNMINFLIQNGIDVNAVDVYGATTLHYTVSEGYYEKAKLLLENGADANKKDNKGSTPIEWTDDDKCIDLLLHYGARITDF